MASFKYANPKRRKYKQVIFNCTTGKSTTEYYDPEPTLASDLQTTCQATEPVEIRSEFSCFENGQWKTKYSYRTIRKPANDITEFKSVDPTCNQHCASTILPESEDHSLQESCRDKSSTPHARRQKKLTDAWSTIKPSLLDAFLKTKSPATFTCSICGTEDENILFCADCGPSAYYCELCTQKVHSISTFHVPVRWIGNIYVPHMWYKEVHLPTHQCMFDTVPSVLVMIDDKGRQHQTVIHFCGCMTKSEALLFLGFWPGSPVNPTTAIDMRFMNKARSFLLEGTLALRNFCASIKDHHTTLPTYGTQVDLYRVLVQECAPQHRSFFYNVTHLDGIVANYPDGAECPVCKKTEETLPKIVSLDANFRLVRKKSSGISHGPPHHGSKFYIEKEEISSFLKSDSSAPSLNNDTCSDFRAGDGRRSAFRANKLDITGLFGSVCIHDYPQLFVDLDAGEKLGYAACLISKWIGSPAGLNITYDIACRLKPYLEKSGMNVDGIGLAVPVFHGYAHEAKCQVQFNPRLLKQYRNTDGENIERLWSYLGQFAYITKEMTSSNRRDLIVDALLHYGEKNVRNACDRMKSRMENAKCEKHEAWVELGKAKDTLRDGGWIIDEATIAAWSSEFSSQINNRSKKLSETSWEEKYATILNTFFSLYNRHVVPPIQRNEVERNAEIDQLEQQLRKFEEKHNLERWAPDSPLFINFRNAAHKKRKWDFLKRLHREAVERRHLILIKKDARGHETAAKVSKQIKDTNQRIHKLLNQYNRMESENPLSFDDVKETDSTIYQDMDVRENTPVPYNLMREVVVASNRIDRCNEEVTSLEIEIYALLEFYKDIHNVLEASIESESHPTGLKAFLIKHLLENEHSQEMIVMAMRKLIQAPQLNIVADHNYIDLIEQQCQNINKYACSSDDCILEEEDIEPLTILLSDNDDINTSDEECNR